ncbi:putative Inter-alpha-trypsin inhibitor heavy chain-related [Quillaja saponaria]|uniref:Inter-alpha-trypsin inhibitor heavy chain-related n=1 Tax=Quillaja saponaria TaxID=32244 RepID=A0AAD7LS39_QUISA|nr:putative Inter-alpha-trypsin inhibitor heavy chain-related [Quillaja saponaria]
MADEFSTSVEYGLKLSKRIYYGKGSFSAPFVPPVMSRSLEEGYLPTAPILYAVISEPEIVENPDIPSYQPYIHGRCVPPALLPLHMLGVSMEIECCLDTAFVTVSGTWRVHCIMAGKKCDCRYCYTDGRAGVEVDITERTYHTEVITPEDKEDKDKAAKAEEGCFLKSQIYTLKVPQVDGGSKISIKISWSQKLLYDDGQFCLNIPFSFPAYVMPLGKQVTKRESIFIKVNSCIGTEVFFKCTSHPLKELMRQFGKVSFLYEAEVPAWSSTDCNFSYNVSSSDISGAMLLQSPFLHDFDQRESFCLCLFPGNSQSRKVFRRDVIFVIDISGSMRGSPLENTKSALLASLSQLNKQDTFNIIAFNGEVQLFSPSMELATKEKILNATLWVDTNFIAKGSTNMMLPLTEAIKLFRKSADSVPLIFLVTDGTVEDEREICNFVKGYVTSGESFSPRLCTFGIGSYCNHYFLQMLAQIGRGHYDAAYDTDTIGSRMQLFFTTALSIIVANITVDALEDFDSLELFPNHIPDVSSGTPLIVSGRYDGRFPDSIKVHGTLADLSNFVIDLKVQKEKDLPLHRVFAKRHIDVVTAQAWFSGSKELEDKVEKMSIQSGVPSEYTCKALVQTVKEKKEVEEPKWFPIQEVFSKFHLQVFSKLNLQKKVELSTQKLTVLGGLHLGFGNLNATAENKSPIKETKSSEATELLVKAASKCCSQLANRCCCMCFIQTCSYMNDQCAIVSAQICAALSCFGCIKCCFELCECDCL